MNRQERRAAGICVDCHAKASGFRARCTKHLAANTRRNLDPLYRKQYKLNERKRRKTAKKQIWLSHSSEYLQEVRLLVLNMLGGPICVDCGCNKLEILEINHINGGGYKERQKRSTLNYYRKILQTDYPQLKYNVMCRVCNSLHYVRDILKISGHKVVWKG